MGELKSLGIAFLVGGSIGAAGNGILTVVGMIGTSENIAPLVTLFIVGFSGCLLFAANKASALITEDNAYSFLPFFGLSVAVADAYLQGHRASGTILGGIVAAWKAFFTATGIGIAIALIVGTLTALTNGL